VTCGADSNDIHTTTIEVNVPPELQVDVILDAGAMHKTPAVHRSLEKRTRLPRHFTPTPGVEDQPGRAVARPADSAAASARRSGERRHARARDRSVHRRPRR
jgi:hypothetical protein